MKHCLAAFSEIGEALQKANRILIASDFDGTLCPIAADPSKVFLTEAVLDTLRHVRQCERVTLTVISGRHLPDVRRRVPLDLIFAGNHGLEIADPGYCISHPAATRLRPLIARSRQRLTGLQRYWPGAWIEDKEFSLTLHYRNVDETRRHALVFETRQCLRVFAPLLALRIGIMSLEIRPKVNWDKGSALRYIGETLGPFDLSICLGDDTTDESMFRANRGQINIRVGPPGRTVAGHCLADPTEVAIFLSRIAKECCQEGGSISRAAPPLAGIESLIDCSQ